MLFLRLGIPAWQLPVEDEGPAVMSYLWIAAGSALGGMARYWCSGLIAHRIGETFPWRTITVNAIGSFVIGIFAALTEPDVRLFAVWLGYWLTSSLNELKGS